MIILTDKRLRTLKEEIKADLRGEVLTEARNAIIDVFPILFDDRNNTVFTSDEAYRAAQRTMWTGPTREMHNVLVNAAGNIACILDHKVKSQYKDEIARTVAEYVQGEDFVDEIISRINRKQLIGGNKQ